MPIYFASVCSVLAALNTEQTESIPHPLCTHRGLTAPSTGTLSNYFCSNILIDEMRLAHKYNTINLQRPKH